MRSSSNPSPAPELNQFVWVSSEVSLSSIQAPFQPQRASRFAPLRPLRQWLENLQIRDRQTAHRICGLIPAQCPFERTIALFGRPVLHIPPLCKLNPVYEELVGLRFRALCYLADECGEDISQYC
jgi:hypothetical protein